MSPRRAARSRLGALRARRGALRAGRLHRAPSTELVAAYCISPFYTILKDIGQAYERELEYEKAIAYFERYVMRGAARMRASANACAPDPQDERENVIARIDVLENAARRRSVINTDPADAKITLVERRGHRRGARHVGRRARGARRALRRASIEREGFITRDAGDPTPRSASRTRSSRSSSR